MQSLPTPITMGNLDEILATLATLPTAKVNRHDSVITVTATRKATGNTEKILSAVTNNGTLWHVMAVPGLINTTFTH